MTNWMMQSNRQIRSIADVPVARRIWLYGAGSLGQRLFRELGKYRVAGFIDQNPTGARSSTIPTIDLTTYLQNRANDDLIVIASSFSREIQNTLKQNGITDYLDAGRLPHFEWVASGMAADVVCKFAREHLKPTDVVFDVGANCGYTSGHFALHAAKVFAFELEPGTISKFMDLWYDDAKVFLFPFGLSDRNGTGRLYLDIRDIKSASSLHADNFSIGDKFVDVTLMTMDTFVAATGQLPDFIKIDVEGHEPSVIRGGWQTISQHRPLIVFEFHEMRWNSGFEELFAELEPLYDFVRLEDGESCLDAYRSGHFPCGVANIACLPKS